MEEILKELAINSPAPVCVIIIAGMFLRALKGRDDTIADIAKDFAAAMDAHTEEGKKLRETLGAHSEVIRRCQQVQQAISK